MQHNGVVLHQAFAQLLHIAHLLHLRRLIDRIGDAAIRRGQYQRELIILFIILYFRKIGINFRTGRSLIQLLKHLRKLLRTLAFLLLDFVEKLVGRVDQLGLVFHRLCPKLHLVALLLRDALQQNAGIIEDSHKSSEC